MEICFSVDWEKKVVCFTEPPSSIVTLGFVWTIRLGNSNFAVTGGNAMAMDMSVNDFVTLSVQLVDQYGNKAPFAQGSAVWTVSDPGSAELRDMSDDGKIASATFWPLGPVPELAVRVSFNCDRDPNTPGNQPLATDGFLDITLLPGVGVSAEIVAGVATPKP